MDAEALGPHGFQLFKALKELLPGKAVFTVPRGVHDLKALLARPQLEDPARVEAAGDGLGDIAQGLLQKVDVGEVVQVDHRPQLFCQLVFVGGGLVGGEHDVMAMKAAFVREHQLGEGGAVHPAALLLEYFQDAGGGGGLHGEILLITRVPGKGGLQVPGGFPDALLIVKMEGGGVGLGDGLELGEGHKRSFHGRRPRFSLYFLYNSTLGGGLSTGSFCEENTKIKKEKIAY